MRHKESQPSGIDQSMSNSSNKPMSGAELFELLQGSPPKTEQNVRPSRCDTHRPDIAGVPSYSKGTETFWFWAFGLIGPPLIAFLAVVFFAAKVDSKSLQSVQSRLGSQTAPFLNESFSTAVVTTLFVATTAILVLFPTMNMGDERLLFRQQLRKFLMPVVGLNGTLVCFSIVAYWVDQVHRPQGAISLPALIVIVSLGITITASCWFLELRNFRLRGSFIQGQAFWRVSGRDKLINRIAKRERRLTSEVEHRPRNIPHSTKISRIKYAVYTGMNLSLLFILRSGFSKDGKEWNAPRNIPETAFVVISATIFTLLLVALPALINWLIRKGNKDKDKDKDNTRLLADHTTTWATSIMISSLFVLSIVEFLIIMHNEWPLWAGVFAGWGVLTLTLFNGNLQRFDPNTYIPWHGPESKKPLIREKLNLWLRFSYAEADIAWAQKSEALARQRIRLCLNQQMFEPEILTCPTTKRRFTDATATLDEDESIERIRTWLTS